MTIGDNIRYYREKQMITQKELAKITGLASGTISRYELDKVIPKKRNIKVIAKALKVKETQLYTNEEPVNNNSISYDELATLIIEFCKENDISIFKNSK